MDYFFENKENDLKLFKILEEWKDTPFRHRCGIKGLGTDCVHFGVKVFEEFGLIKLTKSLIPDYPKDWHYHNTRELLKEAIETYLSTEIVSLNGVLMNGDIILSHYGKASSHVGIYYGGYVYQAISGVGVKKINFNNNKFKAQMKYAYRIKEQS